MARYHLAPGLLLEPAAPSEWLVRDAADVVARVTVEAGDAAVATTLHGARFGVLQSAQTLEVTLRDSRALTRWRW